MLEFAAVVSAGLAGVTAIAGRIRSRPRATATVVLLAIASALAAAHLWRNVGPADGDAVMWGLLLTCSAGAAAMAVSLRRGRRHTVTVHAVIGLMFAGTAAILAPGKSFAVEVAAVIVVGAAMAVVMTVLKRIGSAVGAQYTVHRSRRVPVARHRSSVLAATLPPCKSQTPRSARCGSTHCMTG